MNINLEDPRLSAYALGEMNDAERREFEALLKDDAAARAEVEEIRSLAGLLTSELQAEPGEAMSDGRREKVMAAAAGNVVEMPKARASFSVLRVAAMLAVVFGVAAYVLLPALSRAGKTKSDFALSQAAKGTNTDEHGLARTGNLWSSGRTFSLV